MSFKALRVNTHVCFASATVDEHHGCGCGMSVVGKDQDWLRMRAMAIFEVGPCIRLDLLFLSHHFFHFSFLFFFVCVCCIIMPPPHLTLAKPKSWF